MQHKMWSYVPKMSTVFWLSVSLTYLTAIVALVSLFNPDVKSVLDEANLPQVALWKIYYFRVPMISLFSVLFPILLFTSLRRALVFMRIVAAAVIVIYIDDQLVLYKAIEEPQRLVVRLAVLLRPVVIMALLWITFELHFRVKLEESYQ